MTIRAVGITTGQANPSPVTLSGGYRYQGRPGWPYDPATRDDKGVIHPPQGGAKIKTRGRLARTEEFCRLRAEGLSAHEAAAVIGVERRTRARYEAEWRARQKQRGGCEGCPS